MGEGWIIFGLCALTLIGATLPLLHERRTNRQSHTDHRRQNNDD